MSEKEAASGSASPDQKKEYEMVQTKDVEVGIAGQSTGGARPELTANITEHKLSLEELENFLETDLKKGLTSEEAARRLERDGLNALSPPPSVPWWWKFSLHIAGGFAMLALLFVLCPYHTNLVQAKPVDNQKSFVWKSTHAYAEIIFSTIKPHVGTHGGPRKVTGVRAKVQYLRAGENATGGGKHKDWDCYARDMVHFVAQFESIDKSIRFAAPFLPFSVDSDTLFLETEIRDAGQYDVQVYAYVRQPYSFKKMGSFSVDVIDAISGKVPQSAKESIKLPNTYCHLTSGTSSPNSMFDVAQKGRWVYCENLDEMQKRVGDVQLSCLRNGWVWLPFDCVYRLNQNLIKMPRNTGDCVSRLAANSSSILQKEQWGDIKTKHSCSSSRWIIFMGSSIMRGSAHSLIDIYLRPGMRSTVFPAVHDVPGRGTIMKCWGFLDIEVMQGLRVSYQDYRDGYMIAHRENVVAASKRVANLLSGNPTLIVIEIFVGKQLQVDAVDASSTVGEDLEASNSASFSDSLHHSVLLFHLYVIITNLELMKLSNTRIILAVQKTSTKSGGMEANHCPSPFLNVSSDHGVAPGLFFRQVLNFWNQLLDNSRISSADKNYIRHRVTLFNEDQMAWPFMFDAEFTSDTTRPFRHWHRYAKTNLTGNDVQGTVAEMAARLYFNEALSVPLVQRSWSERIGFADKDIPLRACADCSPTINFVDPLEENPMHSLVNRSVNLSLQWGLHSCVDLNDGE